MLVSTGACIRGAYILGGGHIFGICRIIKNSYLPFDGVLDGFFVAFGFLMGFPGGFVFPR